MNRTRTFMVISVMAAAAAALAGCGSNGNTPASHVANLAQPPSPGGGGRLDGGFRTPPGAFGVAAAVSRNSLEVQNPSTGQTTVDFSGKTTFMRTEPAKLSDVVVGACVTASGVDAASAAALTARSVEISAPVNGSCARRGGFGGVGGRSGGFGGGGFGGSGGPSSRPSSFPTGRPSGSPRLGGGSSVVGKVTAVASNGFTVSGFLRAGRRGFSPEPSARPTATPTTTKVSVAVDTSTTFSRTVTATRGALKVGECIAALGTADDTGAVTAKSIAISPAVNGTCFGGFGRRFGAGTANG